MRVAVVHYHLRAGGVTRVIANAYRALSGFPVTMCTLVGDIPADSTHVPGPVRLVPELDYDADGMTPAELADKLEQTAAAELHGPPDVYHVHNHSLGKSALFTTMVFELARRGRPLLLQIHDFPEDGRPANYRLLREMLPEDDVALFGLRVYPQAPHVHYAVLNGRDQRFMAAAGVEGGRLHHLPNAVAAPGHAARWNAGRIEEECPRGRFFLYPTRAIRRKNIGEFVLWSLLGEDCDRFAVTLAPRNPEARRHYERWVATARELGLPLEFGVGNSSLTHLHRLVETATAIVTTSVAEGFGLAFLEPWLEGRPLVGRNLPEITAEMQAVGLRLDGLYESMRVPLGKLSPEDVHVRLREGLARYYREYGRIPEEADYRAAFEACLQGDFVEMGRLDELLQEKIIRNLVSDQALRKLVRPPALTPSGCCDEELVVHNQRCVMEHYGLPDYGWRLMRIYETVASSEVGEPEPLDAARLLDCFLDASRFTLLRT